MSKLMTSQSVKQTIARNILNIKVGLKYYTSFIIQNVLNNATCVVLSADFDV